MHAPLPCTTSRDAGLASSQRSLHASAPHPCRPTRHQRRHTRTHCTTKEEPASSKQEEQRGSSQGFSGIAVSGYSPTSRRGWAAVKQTLRDANVKMLSPQEVAFAIERGGTPIIDIRPASDYARAHIPTAINVPFYQPIDGWSPMKLARRAGYAMFGILNGTEVNPNFVEGVAAASQQASATPVIYCDRGGTLEIVEAKKELKSRSLIAAWQLVSSGHSVSVMKGGFGEWAANGRPVEGAEVEQ